MDQTTSEVRSEIEEKKAAIGVKLEALEERFDTISDKASNLLNLKQHAQDRPWLVVGIAAGAGFFLGRSGLRLPLAAMAGIVWKAIPAGVGAVLMKSLREEGNES